MFFRSTLFGAFAASKQFVKVSLHGSSLDESPNNLHDWKFGTWENGMR
jgi:hypothetical protein